MGHAGIVLRGRDHPQLGRVAWRGLGDQVGIAISAGAVADPYAHLDPNEDGALAVRIGDAVVLAVVDGNGGVDASDAALGTLASTLGRGAPPRGQEGAWLLEHRGAAMDAATRARRRRPQAHASDTALSLVLVAGGGVVASTVGDTGVVVIGERTQVLSGTVPHLDHTATPAPFRRYGVNGAAAVLVASDGLFDALGVGWPDVVRRCLAQASAAQAAEAIIEQACRAGADDNVSLAVARLPTTS